MKKKIIILTLILIAVIILGIALGKKLSYKNKEYYITDNEALYDVAIQYLVNHDENIEKRKPRYQLFVDHEEFGITEDKDYRYAYMWIVEGVYYVNNNKIISGSGSSIPYKFTFEKKKDKVVRYEIPKDGSEYTKSIQRLFPKDIAKKVLNYTWNDQYLKQEIQEYYSDIEDKNIYYSGEEKYVFTGKIVKAEEKYILVEVLEETEIFKKDEQVSMLITRPTSGVMDFYVVGNNVTMTFDGNVEEKNPLQIGAEKIELMS